MHYRYGYQGEFAETDSETGMPAFELRIWDSRIGRWLAPDPYGQYHSPYLGMGNDPTNSIDRDGGWRSKRRAQRMHQKALDAGMDVGALTKVGKHWGFSSFKDTAEFSGGDFMSGVEGTFNFSKGFLNNSSPMIRIYDPNFFARQRELLNAQPDDKIGDKIGKIIGRMIYDSFDDAYVTFTSFFHKNPRHLDNSGAVRGPETVDAGVNTLTTVAPWAKSSKVLNASQYSKIIDTKGVSHQIRGAMNRNHNRTVKEVKHVKIIGRGLASGTEMTQGTDSGN